MKKLFTPLLLCSCITISTAFADTDQIPIPTPEKYILIDAINKTINQPNFSAIINKTGLLKTIRDLGNIGRTPTGVMTACIANLKGPYDSRKNDCYKFVKAAVTEHNTMVRNKTLAANANVRPIGQKVYSVAFGNPARENKEYYMADCSGEYAKKLAKCVFKTKTNKLVCGFAPESAGIKFENASGCLPYANYSDDFEDGFMWVWEAGLFAPGLYAVEYNSHGINMGSRGPRSSYEAFVSNVFKEKQIHASHIIFDQYLTAPQSVEMGTVATCTNIINNSEFIPLSNFTHISDKYLSKLRKHNDLLTKLKKLSSYETGNLECLELKTLQEEIETQEYVEDCNYIEKLDNKIVTVNNEYLKYGRKDLTSDIKKLRINDTGFLVSVKTKSDAIKIAKDILHKDLFYKIIAGPDQQDQLENYLTNPVFTCDIDPTNTNEVGFWGLKTKSYTVACSNGRPPALGMTIYIKLGNIENLNK